MPSFLWRGAVVAALLGLLASAAAPPAGSDDSPPARTPDGSARAPEDSLGLWWMKFLAREDTAGVPKQYLYGKWVQARAELPTLKEIIRWCIEAEEQRSDLVDDLAFLRTIRTGLFFGGLEDESARRVFVEEVSRVYVRPPELRTVHLGMRKWDSEDAEEEVEVDIRVHDSSDHLTNLPFFFEAIDDYSYRIDERRILKDRVIYKIGFAPRSDFASLPEGWFLIDTKNYQIAHAELWWTKNVPFPLFLKAVDRVVMSRRNHGDVWLDDRTIVTVSLRDIPFVSTPRRAEVDIRRTEVALNAGIPDSIFAP